MSFRFWVPDHYYFSLFLQLSSSQSSLHSIDDLLKVEGANGLPVTYLGYVELSILFPGSLPSSSEIDVPVLVVPDTSYNKKVPLCVGTNIIDTCMERGKTQYGPDFVNSNSVHPTWRSVYICMQRQMQSRSDGRIGVVKNASKKAVRIPANHAVVVEGKVPLPFQVDLMM